MNEQQSSKPLQELLWVYKTPESAVLSRSSQAEAASINSHAQRWQQRSRRLSKHGHREVRQKSGTSRVHPSTRPAHVDILQPFPNLTSLCSSSDWADEVGASASFQGTAIDAFQSSAIKMDYQSNLLLQYYIWKVFPPLWRRMASVRSLPKEPHQF
jgi:hypothetical protein